MESGHCGQDKRIFHVRSRLLELGVWFPKKITMHQPNDLPPPLLLHFSSGAFLMARNTFSEQNGAFHMDHLHKMFISNRVVEQHMENFKNFELDNWVK